MATQIVGPFRSGMGSLLGLCKQRNPAVMKGEMKQEADRFRGKKDDPAPIVIFVASARVPGSSCTSVPGPVRELMVSLPTYTEASLHSSS